MTRRRKFIAVGVILATGLMLAWPFRKAGSDPAVGPAAGPPQVDILRASNGDPVASSDKRPPATEIAIGPAQIPAHPASTGSTAHTSTVTGGLESFDVANHPALAEPAVEPPADAPSASANVATSPTAQPAYLTAPPVVGALAEEWPTELVHVVANGDTLEKLAQRYLNDEGRALEIFDLNRDQLSNPHLLPIGVELRVPRNPDRIVD